MCVLQAIDNGVAEALKLGIVSGIKALFFDKFPSNDTQVRLSVHNGSGGDGFH